MNFRRTCSVCSIFMLLFLLFSCRMDPGFGPGSPTKLPEDKVLDVARSYSGPFTYETLLPVALNLTVDLYRQPNPAAALERQASDGQLIVVSLWNPKGEALYSGAIPPSGTLSTVLSLPAAPQDVVLRLESPGYQTREIKIGGMVLLSEVRRVMALLAEGLSAKALLPDTDLDGVPDIYDVDPLDPEVAFQVRTPASGQFTVAFEDLFPVPGDADYNDFVANYFVVENHKSLVKAVSPLSKDVPPVPIEVTLMNLHGEATAVAKLAGYSHKFGIVIDFPGITAIQVTRSYYDALGLQRTETQASVADRAVIWLFENTSKSLTGMTATFDIEFPKGVTRDMVSIPPYDPALFVLNTGKDIHLVGQDSLSGQQVSYMDPNGYPWALLVPEDWQHPAETQYIGKAYPLFDEWRASKGAVAPYWYLYPASTGSAAGNHPPYPVTAPTANPQLVAGSASIQEFQLSLADPKADPDGDAVQFMSSPAPLALEGLFALKADTGLVTFQPGVPAGDYLFYFWSVDEHGASTIGTPFKATFSFVGKAANQPPAAGFHDLQALGAGSPVVNGYYRENGFNQGRPKYDQVGGGCFLYYLLATDLGNAPYWSIQTALVDTIMGPSSLYYNGTATAMTAPEGIWSLVNGLDPAPAMQRIAITGTLAAGQTLTGHYNYSDPDGDAEGTSTFQWYRFVNVTDASGTPISGATGITYVPQAGDASRFLRLQVTPVDAHGAAGAPVMSGAVRIGG